MKNKKLFLKIYISLLIVMFISIIVLSILGNKERIGYLSEFKLNIDKTLEINGLDVKETKELFTVDNKLNETDITNYIFTNNSITNYSYYFRIKYYSKVFRNSDLYGVYFEVPKSVVINNTSIELKNIKNYETGSPFGNFISTKELKYGDKIDNINYKLKLKMPIWIVFIIAVIYILFNYKLILNISKVNKKLILKILKISSFSILAVFVLLFILGKLNHKANITDLQLIGESKEGYIYKAKLVGKGLFSHNIIYKYDNKVKLKNKPDYIKRGYNILIIDTMPWNSSGNLTAFIDRNYEGFIVSNSNYSQGGYSYNIELSKGEKYIVTLEAKKLSENVGGVIKYNLNSGADITIPNTDKMTDDYQKYISELEIEKDIVAPRPAIRILFPSGVINVKSIKIEQVSDNLYLKSDNNIIFTSTKKIDDLSELKEVFYKLDITIFTKIIFILIILFIVSIYNISIISNFISKIYINDNFVLINNNNNNISNILFVLYIIFLSIYLLSIGYMVPICIDDFSLTFEYNFLYNIFDFKGYFWQRGRHFTDMLGGIYMRPLGSFLVSFGMDAIIVHKIFQSIFYTAYFYILFISSSLIACLLNGKKNYKLIFVVISLFILYISKIKYGWADNYYLTMINVSAYIGTGGISLIIFYPLLYNFLYKKEIVLFKNKSLYYALYIFLIYVATFTIEPVSLLISGISFFILLKMIYNAYSDNNEKINFFIFINLILIIISSISSFILTTFFSGRGKAQFYKMEKDNYSLIGNFISYFNNQLSTLEKTIFILGIILLVFLIINSIKNRKISLRVYIYISFLLVGIIGIIGFSMIKVEKNWIEILLIFIVILSAILQYTKNRNSLTLLGNIVIIALIVSLLFNSLQRYDEFFKIYAKNNSEINLSNIYKDAEKNGLEEIVLTDEDIKKNNLELLYIHLYDERQLRRISGWMYYYKYTSKIIPLKVIKN